MDKETMVRPLLEVEHLAITFIRDRHRLEVVRDVSFTVAEGGSVALIGESGSGKTLTARAIIGLLPENAQVAGSVAFGGKSLRVTSERDMRPHRGQDIAMIFQDPGRALDPTMRIGRQIGEAIRAHEEIGGRELKERAVELLERVRIPAARERVREYPHQLSGGMRQRVMIAIALAAQPRLLIADEATTALDVTTQAQIMELLEDLRRQFGMAVIIISHDLRLAGAYSDDLVVMYKGYVVERAPTGGLLDRVRMPYTRALLDAVPKGTVTVGSRFRTVAGSIESSAEGGCTFAPRCPVVQDDCRVHRPDLVEVAPGHRLACWHPYEAGE